MFNHSSPRYFEIDVSFIAMLYLQKNCLVLMCLLLVGVSYNLEIDVPFIPMMYSQKHYLVLICFLLVGVSYCKKKKSNPDRNCQKCGISSADSIQVKKIINGAEVRHKNKYPWLVSIMKNGRIMCGGALISEGFVITAAHCLMKSDAPKTRVCSLKKMPKSACFDPSQSFQVGVLSRGGDREAIQVADIIPHPQFSILSKVHDVGLMRLERPVQCSHMSRPICLPREDLNKYDQHLIVAGWGRYSNGTTEKKLREGIMTQVDVKKCRDAASADLLCAVANQANQKSCFGDSGSAIFSKFGDKYFALGVTSYGMSRPNELCSLDKPVFFTKAYHYLRWIRKYVKDIPQA